MRIVPARLSDKPHYALHPARALRRALRARRPAAAGVRTAHLAWGLDLDVRADEAIGASILTSGIFDPCVSETLFRLVGPGETAVDAGANVGYMTSLMAVRAGPGGTVHACEPHPAIHAMLAASAARWAQRGGAARVVVHRVALSDHAGAGTLAAGPGFAANMGLAALRAHDDPGAAGAETHAVELRPLDDVIGPARIGVLKIDVEGHEAAVLRGAARLLADGRVRDVVFEDHGAYPDEATELLERAGHTVLDLRNDLFGLRLSAPGAAAAAPAWPGPSRLATRDPDRARALLAPRGWRVPGIGLR